MKQTDFLVIGSGLAGLSLALKVTKAYPDANVIIVTKSDESESNTKYAQGGIAVVSEAFDSLEDHVRDTLVAGDGLCNEEVVKEGPRREETLILYKDGIPLTRGVREHVSKQGDVSKAYSP